jgi:hypothetical protein
MEVTVINRTAFLYVMAMFVVCVLWLPITAAERMVSVTAGSDKIPILSQARVQQLRTSIPRATLVNALLASPATKAPLTDVASKAGIPEANVSSLAAKPIKMNVSRSLIASGAEAAEYAKFDWSAGIFFNPLFPPKYANDKYNLGEYYISYSDIETAEEGIVHFHFIPGSATMNSEYSIIGLWMELPPGAASYAIALNLTDSQGNSPAAWISGEPRLKVTVWSGGKEYPVAMTTLAGQPGFVGIVSANIVDGHPSMGSKMRATSASIHIRFTMLAGKPLDPNSLDFGGITVTRL